MNPEKFRLQSEMPPEEAEDRVEEKVEQEQEFLNQQESE